MEAIVLISWLIPIYITRCHRAHAVFKDDLQPVLIVGLKIDFELTENIFTRVPLTGVHDLTCLPYVNIKISVVIPGRSSEN